MQGAGGAGGGFRVAGVRVGEGAAGDGTTEDAGEGMLREGNEVVRRRTSCSTWMEDRLPRGGKEGPRIGEEGGVAGEVDGRLGPVRAGKAAVRRECRVSWDASGLGLKGRTIAAASPKGRTVAAASPCVGACR